MASRNQNSQTPRPPPQREIGTKAMEVDGLVKQEFANSTTSAAEREREREVDVVGGGTAKVSGLVDLLCYSTEKRT